MSTTAPTSLLHDTFALVRHQSRRPERLAFGARRSGSTTWRGSSAEHETGIDDVCHGIQLSSLRRTPRQRKTGRRLRCRVLARQVGIDQCDLLRRHRPAHSCRLRRGAPRCARSSWPGTPTKASSLMLLPIETRLDGLSLTELRPQRRAWKIVPAAGAVTRNSLAAVAARSHTHQVSSARIRPACARFLGRRCHPDDNPPLDERRPRRGAGLAPCADQLPASACSSRAWWCSTRRASTPSVPSPNSR